MRFLPRTLPFILLASSAIACAQCPVNTVMVKGRVENPPRDSKVRVQLVYAKDQPGESAETTVENGTFRLPVEFLTQSSRPLLKNLKPKCDRKPLDVIIKLLEGDQERFEVTLKFAHAFTMPDPTAYTPRSEIVLKGAQ